MRRLLAFLLALTAALSLMQVQPAAADGPIGNGVEVLCVAATGPVGALIGYPVVGGDLCDKVGESVARHVNAAWKDIWDSVLGDVIKSAEDVVKWLLQKVFTVALAGPSLDLAATGLFGRDATLSGMLVWLGWVIAAVGLMWQLGKMAVTGQMKYAGQALVGWVQNALLTGIGVTMVALLLKLGDLLTTGLVNKTFDNGGLASKRIIAVMMPAGIDNPMMALGVVVVLLLVGFVQLVMVFLRQSAIPIQCLLLPIAGAGRVGGETTRQWAPRLINSILVVIAYKPILAVIICAGFSEFGHAQTLAEWLRGLATLLLAVLAPGPLTKLFAPFSEAIGGGLSAGGAIGAAASAGSYIGSRSDDGGDSGNGGGPAPTNAVEHSKHVEQTMKSQKSQSQGQGQDSPGSEGGDAVPHAARNDAAARVPSQAGPAEAAGAGTGAAAGGGTGAAASAGAAPAAGPGALALVVLDGLNDAVQKGSSELGEGGGTL